MICERYWQQGILEVERGVQDPHRDTCHDCRRAHAARGELIEAMPHVGATRSGDPNWQVRVWRRIAHEETRRARRSYWLGGGLAAACALAVVWLLAVHRDPGSPPWQVAAAFSDRPSIEIVSGTLAQRSTSARVGARARISVRHAREVTVSRADRLVL